MRGMDSKSKTLRSPLRRVSAIMLMCALMVASFSLTVFAQNSYIITDGDDVTVHKSYSDDPDVVLNEVGIELSEEDTYTTTYDGGVSHINIQRMQMITVNDRGVEHVVGTYGETVAALLHRMGISLEDGAVLTCEETAQTYDGMIIEVIQREIEFQKYDEVIPCRVNVFEDPELAPGEEIVLIEGEDGQKHIEAQVVYENGVEVSRVITKETVVSQAVTRLIVRGPERAITKQPDEPDHRVAYPDYMYDEDESTPESTGNTDTIGSGTITTSTGVSYSYSHTITCLATAYSCEGYTGITYSGTVARVGAIAVDPRVIPIGTKMYVVSVDGEYVYGYCTAEDTGGSIKGYRVDLYFDTIAECFEFGARDCLIYILSEG